MEPQVRYVTSADGTKIATWTIGKGTPLVVVTSIWSTPIEIHWFVPSDRSHWERLAQGRTCVLYDNRGQGVSDREVTDFSLTARVSDLAAVVEGLHSPTVDVMGMGNSGPVAITYAAENPDKVRRLVLTNAAARGRDLQLSPQRRAIHQLVDVDWLLFQKIGALLSYGFADYAGRVAETAAASVSPEVFTAATRAAWQFDASDAASSIACPCLVLHQRTSDSISLDAVRRLAATIPDSRLVVYDHPHTTLLGSDETVQNIEVFLDEEATPEATSTNAPPSGMTAILFVDIADSTALTERLGDGTFREKARELDSALRGVISEHGGNCIDAKTLGDGVLATFASARQGIEAAMACSTVGAEGGMPLHVGLHAGDVIRESDLGGRDNVYGGAVNVAARVCGLSAAGEVLVSDTVRSLARTSAGVEFEDRGEQTLKGVGEAVRMWAVKAEEQGTRNREHG